MTIAMFRYCYEFKTNEMRKVILMLMFGVLSAPFLMGQSVEKALGNEDLDAITSQMANRLEICVPGKTGSFSKSEATSLLKNFFDTHQVSSYQAKHSGNQRERDSNYTIGSLVTDKATYRVYVYYADAGGSKLIQELCIEK